MFVTKSNAWLVVVLWAAPLTFAVILVETWGTTSWWQSAILLALTGALRLWARVGVFTEEGEGRFRFTGEWHNETHGVGEVSVIRSLGPYPGGANVSVVRSPLWGRTLLLGSADDALLQTWERGGVEVVPSSAELTARKARARDYFGR